MANPSKQKGTAGETELRKKLDFIGAFRMPAGARFDLMVSGADPAIGLLATRPDRGEWLLTLRLEDFLDLRNPGHLYDEHQRALNIEVKRYKKFSLHTIFASKFGGNP